MHSVLRPVKVDDVAFIDLRAGVGGPVGSFALVCHFVEFGGAELIFDATVCAPDRPNLHYLSPVNFQTEAKG